MALTYLAGGRTLTGVIFQSTWHQHQQDNSASSSTSVSPTLRPLVSAIGELSSFLTRQSFSPPPTPGVITSSEISIQEPFSSAIPSSSHSQEATHSFFSTSCESTTAINDNNHINYTTATVGNNYTNNDEKELFSLQTQKEGKDLTIRSDESLILRRMGADAITRTLLSVTTHDHMTNHLVDLNLTRNNLTDLPDILSTLCPHLKFLNISFNLFTMIPPVLFQMHRLISLNLADNQITEIPPEFPFSLPYLEDLLLFGNLLTHLPETIQNWTRLTCLQLGSEFSGNRLTELPNHLPPAIQVLNISHNRLLHLHPLADLKELVTLDASYNQLQSLAKTLIEWQQIRTIHVSNNRLTWLPSDIVELDSLELLNVSYNLMNVFPEGLLENRSLNVMITGNPLTYPGQQSTTPFSPVIDNQQQRRHHRRRSTNNTFSSSSSSSSMSGSESDGSDSDINSDEQIERVDEERYEDSMRDGHNNDHRISSQTSTPFNHLFLASPSLSMNEQYQRRQATINEENNYDPNNSNSNNINDHDPGVNSLYEIAFRQILRYSPSSSSSSSPGATRRIKIPTDHLPTHLSQIHHEGENFTCVVCKGPFLREWVSSTYLRNYRGYPSVARNIRFCSRQCSRRHSERAREIAQRQQQLSTGMMSRPPSTIDFESFEWIVAAADAAREQQAIEEDWF